MARVTETQCIACRATFPRTGKRGCIPKRCPPCKREHERERDRHSPTACSRCQTHLANRGGRRIYCGPCAIERRREREREREKRRKGRQSRWAHVYRSAEWRRVRAAAYERDDFTCQTCGQRDPTKQTLSGDHVVSLSDGGAPFDLDNVATRCRPCHGRLDGLRAHGVSAAVG